MIPPLLMPNRPLILDGNFGANVGRMGLAETQRNFDPNYPNGDVTLSGNGERQVYMTDWSQHQMLPVGLRLNARVNPGRVIVGTTSDNPVDTGAIQSAMLSTKQSFEFGYFEVKAKGPPASAKGAFPCMGWLTVGKSPPTQWWGPEVDNGEIPNNSGSMSVDDGPGNPFFIVPGGGVEMLDPSVTNQWGAYEGDAYSPRPDTTAMHIYGIEWVKYKLPTGGWIDRWRRYFDARCVSDMLYAWKHPNGLRAGPAHFYVNLAYGGSWAGRNGINPAGLPCAVEIEYVRVYGQR